MKRGDKPVSSIMLEGKDEASRNVYRIVVFTKTVDGGFRISYSGDYTKFTKEDRTALIAQLLT